MAIDDAYGFMQGFMGGQAHVSDMKTAEASRQQQYADLAAKRFEMEDAYYNRPLNRELARLKVDQANLDYNFNKETSRWKVDEFIANAKNVVELQPYFVERAKAQSGRDLVAIESDKFNIAIQSARSPEEQNAVLAKFGKNMRVKTDANGNSWGEDLAGKAITARMPSAMFNLGLMNPMKAESAFVENALNVDYWQNTRPPQVNYPTPDMGMGAAPPADAAQASTQTAVSNRLNPNGAATATPTGATPSNPPAASWDYANGKRPLSSAEEKAAWLRTQAAKAPTAPVYNPRTGGWSAPSWVAGAAQAYSPQLRY